MFWWWSRHPLAFVLWPFGLLFRGVAGLRRIAYRRGWLARQRLSVPVVVVGNLSVGGSGKTPLVIALVALLREAGYRPGVVSRGYGGRSHPGPRRVAPDSDPTELGDEPVLIARRAGCPVVVDWDRPQAARAALALGCDLILSDDGLQHYALDRTLEIVVIDGRRRFGNGWCLPAGPLREPPSRLRGVDLVIVNGPDQDTLRPGEYGMRLLSGAAVNLLDPQQTRPLAHWRGQTVHAVAGIGDPERFFAGLRDAGIRVLAHPKPDHHRYRAHDLRFADPYPVLLTEKDAVKCRAFASKACWMVPVTAEPEHGFRAALLRALDDSR